MRAGPVNVATSSSTGEEGGEGSLFALISCVGKEENRAEGDCMDSPLTPSMVGRREGRRASVVLTVRLKLGRRGSADRARAGPL